MKTVTSPTAHIFFEEIPLGVKFEGAVSGTLVGPVDATGLSHTYLFGHISLEQLWKNELNGLEWNLCDFSSCPVYNLSC